MKLMLILLIFLDILLLAAVKAEFEDLGCWKDSSSYPLSRSLERTNPILNGNYGSRNDAVKKCEIAAREAGYVIFALQKRGECRSGFTSITSYKSYGQSNLCGKNGKGGMNSNQVYRINYPATVIISSLGCWNTFKGKVPIPVLKTKKYMKDASDIVQICASVSASYGYDVFGIRGNECYSDSEARSLYETYGKSRNCSQAGDGGDSSFQAYEINAAMKKKLLGCWQDASYTSGGPASQNISGYFSYRCVANRTQVVNSCIEEKKQIHYDVIGLTDQPCMTDENNSKLYHRAITNDCRAKSVIGIVHYVYQAHLSLQRIPLTSLGCWKVVTSGLIHSLEGSTKNLRDSYVTRANAIEKCAQAAIVKGYDVIALTDRGKCLSGYTTRDHYKEKGMSKTCGTSGKGTKTTMQVYELNIMYIAKYNNLGCWRDKGSRAIPTIENTSGFLDGSYLQRKNAFQKCARAAFEKGYIVFALQHGGWCASSPNALQTYRKYDRYNACRNDGEGGTWANQVYELESLAKVWMTDLGCWKDSAATKLIPALAIKPGIAVGHYLSEVETITNSKIQKCARAAFTRGYSFFALQEGVCRASRNAGLVYKSLGASDKCSSSGYGGPSSNQVYQISVIKQMRFY